MKLLLPCESTAGQMHYGELCEGASAIAIVMVKYNSCLVVFQLNMLEERNDLMIRIVLIETATWFNLCRTHLCMIKPAKYHINLRNRPKFYSKRSVMHCWINHIQKSLLILYSANDQSNNAYHSDWRKIWSSSNA